MALPVAFQEEITAVDAAKTITSKTPADDPIATAGYGLHDWSYSYNAGTSTYTVLGGTDLACVHGAAALMDALGYRF